ncbi:MAG: restriction endonuclease subunit S [Deltaproteobacteria bacterium]|nr:restriction endonuclease subunit S [Deltaproteobacteria bacterium]
MMVESNDWETVDLDQVADLRAGYGFPRTMQGKSSGNFPFAKVGDISNVVRSGGVYISKARNYVDIEQLALLRAKPFPSGSIVFAKIGEAIRQNYRAISKTEMLFDNNVMGVIPDNKKIMTSFLYHFLNTVDFYRLAGKTTVPAIRKSTLQQLQVPLPPLEEQERIAAILDKADAIRRKRKEAIALTDEFLRSAFLDMFGDPVLNPKGWDVKPLRNCIANIQAGWSSKSEARSVEDGEWGVLKISAVTTGRYLPGEHKAVGHPEFKKAPIVPQVGDLLFSRANTRELVAATCLVDQVVERLFLPDKLWKIETEPKVMNREYLRYLLSHDHFRSFLTRKATGTSGSMLNVSQTKLLELKVPVPSITSQDLFQSIVWRAYALRQQTEAGLLTAENLFNALVQRAFRGELYAESWPENASQHDHFQSGAQPN